MNATLEDARVWVTSLATPHEGVQRWHITAKTPVKDITISISRIKKPGTSYQEFRASPMVGDKKFFRKAQWNRVLAVVVDSLERQVRNEPGVPAPVLPTAGEINEARRLKDLAVRFNTTPAIWIFTSNEDAEDWEPRFLSRFTHLAFSNQKLAEPATEWICRIASLEGLILDHDAGEKIIRASKNNLRGALQHLEAMLGQQLDLLHPMMPGFIMAIPGALPVINVPMSEAKTTMPAA